jgi:hypothetical protein
LISAIAECGVGTPQCDGDARKTSGQKLGSNLGRPVKNRTLATAIIAIFGDFFLRIRPFRLNFVKMAVASGRIAN